MTFLPLYRQTAQGASPTVSGLLLTPMIVLVSTAYAAGIINQAFFVSLVMLSVVTSLLAGSWLGRAASRLGAPSRRHQQAIAEVPGELGLTTTSGQP